MDILTLSRPQFLVAVLSILTTNALIGHFVAPFGLLLTMVVLPALAISIASTKPAFGAITGCLYFLVLFALNDTLLKLFSGGTHDGVGSGWMFMTTVSGLLPASVLMAVWLARIPRRTRLLKVAAFSVLLGLIGAHLALTFHLGEGGTYWYPWNNLL